MRTRLLLLLYLLLSGTAQAGGGPETTLLVVNTDSPESIIVADHYAQLRHIPENHIVRLNGIPTAGTIDVDTFRNKIWKPIKEHMQRTGLEQEIDIITYSAGFPYRVNVRADIKKHKLPGNQYRGEMASLTGATYFARRVEIGDVGYLSLNANQYYRYNLTPRTLPPRPATEAELALTKKAAKAIKEKDYALAAETYKALIDSYPWNDHAWYDLARSLAALGETEEALAALSKAVDRGWIHSLATRNDGAFNSLHPLPAFNKLLQRMEESIEPFEPTHGFRSRYLWSRTTLPLDPEKSLDRYYLSTLLAYTGERGNSLPEILIYLTRAAESDGTHPDGTVYLLENSNVRAETRQRYFPITVAALEKRGRRAEILSRATPGQDGVLPRGKDDVIGAVIGTQKFNWEKSGSRFLPGAIAESLTSYGGHFDSGAQTKLTEFLRHGAAGSSGAVAEPFSFQDKFPVSHLHVYYAEGYSLAEAFYQSISGPYQLIIVGDPLARPYSSFAKVRLKAPPTDTPWQGVVAILPDIQPTSGHPIERVELWIDGRLVAHTKPGETVSWNTNSVESGSHDLRLVAIESGPVETRSFFKTEVRIENTRNVSGK